MNYKNPENNSEFFNFNDEFIYYNTLATNELIK